MEIALLAAGVALMTFLVGLWFGNRRGIQAGDALVDSLERLRISLASEIREGDRAQQRATVDSVAAVSDRVVLALVEHAKLLQDAREAQARSGAELLAATLKELSRSREVLAGAVRAENERLAAQIAGAIREQRESAEPSAARLAELVEAQRAGLEGAVSAVQAELAAAKEDRLRDFRAIGERVAQAVAGARGEQAQALEALTRELMATRVDQIRALVGLRVHVDAALTQSKGEAETIEARLDDSFREIGEQLGKLQSALREVRAPPSGEAAQETTAPVTRLPEPRGGTPLESVLAAELAPELYDRDVEIEPGSGERVAFAVRLAGGDGAGPSLVLPVDAAFPLEDWERLQDALEQKRADAVEEARASLRRRALKEAHRIGGRYVAPPLTADFALMYVPSDGLHDEILRLPGLSDELHRYCHVIAVGPTALRALVEGLLTSSGPPVAPRGQEVLSAFAATRRDDSDD